jgi:FtsP/CotA-like multicopper oxidase with cupredoxin domain
MTTSTARTRGLTSLVLGPALAYGAGLWLVLVHHAEGAHEHGEPGFLLHWLRDSTLALPPVFFAVALALALGGRLLGRASEPVRVAALAGTAAVAAAATFGAGTPAHAALFAAHEHHELSMLVHALRDALLALVAAVPIAGTAAWLTLRDRERTATARRRVPRYVAVCLAASLLAGAAAWSADANIPEPGILETEVGPLVDRESPCWDKSPRREPFQATLPIPSVLTPTSTEGGVDYYEITERTGTAEIIPGIRTPVWGYNGLAPGPTIQARLGRPVKVKYINGLRPEDETRDMIDMNPHELKRPSATVVHAHGLNTDWVSDGYPENMRNPGESVEHTYPNRADYQRPATMWYHDHALHATSKHVYRGLAGFYLLTDEVEDNLNLPQGYGRYDIPLLIADRMIDPDTGQLVYNNCSTMGAFGDVMTVNGKQQPRFEVANRKYRFRLLNGSDARQYLLALQVAGAPNSGDQQFSVTGSDHGLLENPEPTTTLHSTPAERYEFVFDFSRYPVGTRLVLVNKLVDQSEPWHQIMAFDVTREEPDTSEIVGRPEPALNAPDGSREMQFNRSGGFFSINDLQWDKDRVDADPTLNRTEEWVLVNKSGGWGHPIHIHLGKFKIIDIDGRAPKPGESGWKDVVWVGPNQRVRVRHEFFNYTGRFAFHCHNSSHEDHDMMGQFEVKTAN